VAIAKTGDVRVHMGIKEQVTKTSSKKARSKCMYAIGGGYMVLMLRAENPFVVRGLKSKTHEVCKGTADCGKEPLLMAPSS
jgi:acetoin utilization deacetylase AcuC-like enzyme